MAYLGVHRCAQQEAVVARAASTARPTNTPALQSGHNQAPHYRLSVLSAASKRLPAAPRPHGGKNERKISSSEREDKFVWVIMCKCFCDCACVCVCDMLRVHVSSMHVRHRFISVLQPIHRPAWICIPPRRVQHFTAVGIRAITSG